MNKHEMILNMKINNIIFKRERCNHVEIFQKFKRNDLKFFLENFIYRYFRKSRILFSLARKNILYCKKNQFFWTFSILKFVIVFDNYCEKRSRREI